MPAHQLLEGYLDEYVKAAGIGAEKASSLFRTFGGRGRKQVIGGRMTRQHARRMIVRRAFEGRDHHPTRLPYRHTFRATGITEYLLNGGLLEYTRQMAAHESARTTTQYDRCNDQVTLDQVERIGL
jgi:integrase/recombinase XerD